MKRDCPICGMQSKKLIFDQKFISPNNGEYKDGYQIVICTNCDFAYADNVADQKISDNYYRKDNTPNMKDLKRRLSSDKLFSEPEHEIIRVNHSIKNILPYLSRNNRILDIGCGTGRLLSLLKQNGYKDILGLEPSPAACMVAKIKYGIEVYNSSLFDDLDIGKFDFIILNHILEHIENISYFIYKLKQFMKPDACVYIEVPDVYNYSLTLDRTNVLSAYLTNDIFSHFSPEHINLFSIISLNNLMKISGFQPLFLSQNKSIMGVISSIWEQVSLHRDQLVETNLNKYIEASYDELKEIYPIIDQYVKNQDPIIIWGAGLHTQRLLEITDLKKMNIIAFIDSDEMLQGDSILGKPIISPEAVKESSNYPILISSKRSQKEIERKIKLMDLKNQVILLYSPETLV